MSNTTEQQISTSPEKFLAFDYTPSGRQLKLKDDTEFYAAGSPQGKKGVILLPDTMGWNAGRIRNIADYLGENECLAVVPALLGSSKEAEAGPSLFESHSWGEYIKESTFAHFRPKIHSLVNHLKEEGVEKISLIGFSWGGWLVANILGSELANEFVCGVLCHPSINLEEKVYGGSVLELMSRINRPILLIQSKGEPRDYQYLLHLLKHKAPSSDLLDFSFIDSGFLLRGNIDQREIRSAIVQSMQEICSFINQHNEMKVEDLVREVPKSSRRTEFGGRVEGEGLIQQARQGISKVSEYVSQTGHRVMEGVQQVYQGTGERVEQGVEKVKESGHKAYEGTQQLYNQAGERIQQGMEQVGDVYNQAGEKIGQGMDQAKQTSQEYYNKAGEKIGQSYEQIKQSGLDVYNKYGERINLNLEQGKQGAKDMYDKAGEYTNQAREQAGEQLQHAKQSTQETYNQAKDQASKGMEQTKQQAQDTYKKGEEYTNKGREKAGETWEQTKQGAQDTSNQAGEQIRQTKDQAGKQFEQTKQGTQESQNRGDKDTHKQSGETGKSYVEAVDENIGETTKQAGEGIKEKSSGDKGKTQTSK